MEKIGQIDSKYEHQTALKIRQLKIKEYDHGRGMKFSAKLNGQNHNQDLIKILGNIKSYEILGSSTDRPAVALRGSASSPDRILF